LKVTSCITMSKKEEVKNQDFMGKTNLILSTLSFSPRGVSATWLHIGALQKIRKNELNTRFQQKFTTGSYRVGIGCAWSL
jgi:hypothetical protein